MSSKKLNVKVCCVILNKVSLSYLSEEIKLFMQQAFASAGIKLLGVIPKIDLEGLGAIPEIEIKYEDFGAKAVEIMEKSLELDRIVEVAQQSQVAEQNYDSLAEKFQRLLVKDSGFGEARL